ncbi:MAG TPA: hypothetical protein GX717_04770, partial [Clostridiaceae bacterium]|nr:hypothetical protein [Clostridiaceae bacterium]
MKQNTIPFEKMPELRRKAYVDALLATRAGKTIIGYFGADVPEYIIHDCGAYAVPVMGLDGYIFSHNEPEEQQVDCVCDVIRSTLTYLKKDKCPLQHASSAYVLGGSCPEMYKAIRAATDKPVYQFMGDERALETWLREILDNPVVKQTTSQNIFREINNRLNRMATQGISGRDLWLTVTYVNYILEPE